MHVEWLSACTFDGERAGEGLEMDGMQQLKEATGIGLHPAKHGWIQDFPFYR